MPGAVGKLFVSLTTKTGPYSKGMQKAGSITKKFVGGVAGLGVKVAKVGAIMGAAAVGGIALYTRKSFEAIDAQAKLARQVGTTIDGLRGLQRAAVITGASEEAVTKGLGFLGKALGEAKTGIGEGKQALEELGLSADDLAELPVEQAVSQIADKMNLLATQSDKAFVASKLFGRGGLALINTLALGSKGLEEMAEGTKTLQGSMTAIDAAKVEQANDAVADMGMTFRSVFDRIAVAVAPFVKNVADNLARLFIFIRESVGPLVPMFLDRLKTIAQGALAFVSKIIGWFRRIPGNIKVVALEFAIIWSKLWTRARTEWVTFKTIFAAGWQGIGALVTDMAGNIAKAFLTSIKFIGDKLVQVAQFLVDKLPGENKWAQNIIDGYKQGLGAVDNVAEKITKKSEDRWKKFWAQNQEGRKNLTSDLETLNSQLATLKKSLTEKQVAALAGETGVGNIFSKLVASIRAVKLPQLTEAVKDGGDKAGDAIKKAAKGLVSPAALEKGTVAAFSANLKASFSKTQKNGQQTVKELKESNRIGRETNNILVGTLGQTVVMEIA
jgi:hypothetical protein